MSKPGTRFEVVTPPWIKDPSKWPFGKVILPPQKPRVKRLLVDASVLSSQLRCSPDLVAAFMKAGQLHEASENEKNAGLGLCAEDLVALGLAGHLCFRHALPLNALVFQVISDLRMELLQAPKPLRVLLGVFRANKRIEARVGTFSGPLAVFDAPADQLDASDFYDASSLRDRMDEAIETVPLALPRADSCLIARPPRQR